MTPRGSHQLDVAVGAHRRWYNGGMRFLIAIGVVLLPIIAVGAAEPVAFVLCGGNGPANEYPASFRAVDFVEQADAIANNVRQAGIKRVLYHNPGGLFFKGWTPDPTDVHNPALFERFAKLRVDTRAMWIDQWLLAESSRCRFADREKLAAGHELLRRAGVTEVIYYVGSPDTLRDAAKEGPACVEMFVDCGPGASVAFDAVAWEGSRWKAGDDVCEFFSSLRKQGVKVYIEPRLTAKQAKAGLGKYVDGTISEHRVDQMYKPDFAIQPGETIVDTGDLPTAQVQIPAGLTPCYRGPLNWNEPLSQ